ncbi:hemolysin III family protein [Siccirubricoccus sp. KC 17139]|uniref:Hemolysin III family protein n=1 Tax=Siccirubricoccus soli TaxID=2899147 RepID=A0ABT1D429_9PROT|nr:hemolysin III family protein [Siccirubricoccus soli]MCO6415964.1 hemolysin III family protein [Siccirubricoccus soli]MCP2682096.1 hemolysin III family protein [Siccirubricoccus soli]
MRAETPAEHLADAAVHAVGLGAVLAGIPLLLALPSALPLGTLLALLPYLLGLLASFACSAAYNLARDRPGKALLRRLDHAAIFLLIGGTYTPVARLAIGGTWGAVLLAVVWSGALAGAAIKLLAPGRYERALIAAYLSLGWVGLMAMPVLLEALPPLQLGLLGGGGLLYSLGVLVHVSPWLPYGTAAWHALVVVAAACHYAVILQLATC